MIRHTFWLPKMKGAAWISNVSQLCIFETKCLFNISFVKNIVAFLVFVSLLGRFSSQLTGKGCENYHLFPYTAKAIRHASPFMKFDVKPGSVRLLVAYTLFPYTAKATEQKTFTYRGDQQTRYTLLATLPLTWWYSADHIALALCSKL